MEQFVYAVDVTDISFTRNEEGTKFFIACDVCLGMQNLADTVGEINK